MICSVCKRNRDQVSTRKSALMPSIDLILCSECLEKKREPRYLIVLAGRSGKSDLIRPYLRHGRYVGEPITAAEIFV